MDKNAPPAPHGETPDVPRGSGGAAGRWRAAGRWAVALAAGGGLMAAASLAPVAMAQTQAGPAFTDISGNPEAPAISLLASLGVVNGYGNGLYAPNQTITRAEFTAIVVRMLGTHAQEAAAALANTTPQFADAMTIPTYAWGDVNYAQGQGLINGFPDHTFRPNDPVTMVQAAAVLIRALGDTASVPSGTWPANYTLAAYDLNIANNTTFVANLPASRGDVAQMAVNAALDAPTLQSGYVSGTPTGTPLYFGGDGFGQIAWSGTVTGVTTSEVSLANAQGTTVLSDAPLASSYYLFGASAVTALQGLQATVVENGQGQIVFIQAQAGTSSQNGALASSSVATPSGYSRIGDFLVGNSTGDALLLANGDVIPVVGATSSAGTSYYLNAPTAGAAADSNALVAGAANLQDGDPVTVTLNSAGKAVAVYATNVTQPYGVVSAIDATAGTLTYTTGPSDNTSTTVKVQPWTAVTLNGASSSLANLEPGDVVAVQIVGNGNGGDTNAREIAATRQTVSGTIASITTQTGPNGTTAVLGITESGGQTTDVTEDPSFDANGVNLAVGDAVQVVLDGSGQAREVQSLSPQQTVVLVEGVQTQINATGTSNQIVVNSAGSSETYDLASGVAEPAQPPTGGYLAVLTFTPGTTTVQSVTPLVQTDATSTLRVLSDSGGYTLIQQYNSAGQSVGSPIVVAQSAGAVVYSGTTYEPFSSLTSGATVTLWSSPQGTPLGLVE